MFLVRKLLEGGKEFRVVVCAAIGHLSFVSSGTKPEGEVEKRCPGAGGRCAWLGLCALLTTELGDSSKEDNLSIQRHSKIEHLDFVQELVFLWLCTSLTVGTYLGVECSL